MINNNNKILIRKQQLHNKNNKNKILKIPSIRPLIKTNNLFNNLR